jgi:hypothetical protein
VVGFLTIIVTLRHQLSFSFLRGRKNGKFEKAAKNPTATATEITTTKKEDTSDDLLSQCMSLVQAVEKKKRAATQQPQPHPSATATAPSPRKPSAAHPQQQQTSGPVVVVSPAAAAAAILEKENVKATTTTTTTTTSTAAAATATTTMAPSVDPVVTCPHCHKGFKLSEAAAVSSVQAQQQQQQHTSTAAVARKKKEEVLELLNQRMRDAELGQALAKEAMAQPYATMRVRTGASAPPKHASVLSGFPQAPKPKPVIGVTPQKPARQEQEQ